MMAKAPITLTTHSNACWTSPKCFDRIIFLVFVFYLEVSRAPILGVHLDLMKDKFLASAVQNVISINVPLSFKFSTTIHCFCDCFAAFTSIIAHSISFIVIVVIFSNDLPHVTFSSIIIKNIDSTNNFERF